jgi:hypothetical protein
VAQISLAQKLAEIDARTQKIEDLLVGLTQMTARHQDGRSLINVVSAIENKLNAL